MEILVIVPTGINNVGDILHKALESNITLRKQDLVEQPNPADRKYINLSDVEYAEIQANAERLNVTTVAYASSLILYMHNIMQVLDVD